MAKRSLPRRLTLTPLEPRENPAGVVTATLSPAGVLTITGDDQANQIAVDFVANTTTITANNGETGLPGAPLTGAVKSVIVKMAGGADIVTLTGDLNAGIGSVAFNMGDGDNTVDGGGMTRLQAGPLSYIGGDGEDTFTLKTTTASNLAGGLTVAGGVGNLSITLDSMAALPTAIAGAVTVTNTFGNTHLTLTNATAKKVTVMGGDANDLLNGGQTAAAMTNTALTGSLTVTAGYTDVEVNVSGGRLKGATLTSKKSAVVRATNVNGGVGDGSAGDVVVTSPVYAEIDIDQTNVAQSAFGKLTATAGLSGEARVTMDGGTLQPGDVKTVGAMTATGRLAGVGVEQLTRAGALSATSKAGAVDPTDPAPSFVGASVAVADVGNVGTVKANGQLAAGVQLTNTVETGAISAVSLKGTAIVLMSGAKTGTAGKMTGGNITVTGAFAQFWMEKADNVVNGNLTVTSTTSDMRVLFFGAGVDLTVQGETAFTGANVSFDTPFNADDLVFKGNVRLTQTKATGHLDFRLRLDSATFEKNLAVKVAGSSSTQFFTTGLTEVKGDYTLDGGVGEDLVTLSENFKAKNVKLNAKNGELTVTLGAPTPAPLAITGNLSIVSGAGNDIIYLYGVAVGGTTTLLTGGGADLVGIDNSTLAGTSKMDTGAGDDQLFIGTASTTQTKIMGLATWTLGAGNDVLTLGDASLDPVLNKVLFANTLSKIDGGLSFDDVADNPSTDLLPSRLLGFEA